ncbi:MAG: site-2 protease family protein [Gomphosphaeria aponina SAG 52.96 = DSM 107014]|uniref:Site-2 protease family protein n=1 Tax=Gomphosphaeria aponina SAG 52.96 = DSM 107014 TaxID=1521640 RepID=A0A941GQE7_9CHRO|nr:site-2 protease family protein [Gomphosphaeria aponina SAG 52.96 = DSM 107014]
MELWFILIIFLGVFTYFLIRSSSAMTTTPIWLLWLVIMTPALIWSAWLLLFGLEVEIPALLMIIPFVVCPLVYVWVFQKGRKTPETTQKNWERQPENEQETIKVLEELGKIKPIDKNEEKALRNCFPWGLYYLQNIDYRPQAILCRGKLRAVPEVAYKKIKENVEKVFGDRFLVIFQESLQGQPFFALVPNPWAKSKKKQETSEELQKPGLVLGLLLITLFTTTIAGVEMSGISAEQFQSNPALLMNGLPYSLGLMTILGCHEFSHYLTAIRYKVKATLPYFIPFPGFLGTFGAFVQMRSPLPHRQAIFDVAIAGPIGGLILTLPILFWGLSQSEIVPIAENSSMVNIEALDPRFSFLFSLIAKFALGNSLTQGMAIQLHPAAVAGYIGLIITALNLIPVGQLDGGHIVHAMLGQRAGIIISQVTRILMFILAMVHGEFLIWAIFLLLMPAANPALNDVTELDNGRDFLGMVMLVFVIAIILPLPGTIAQLLNI